jgi:hypothetical protein
MWLSKYLLQLQSDMHSSGQTITSAAHQGLFSSGPGRSIILPRCLTSCVERQFGRLKPEEKTVKGGKMEEENGETAYVTRGSSKFRLLSFRAVPVRPSVICSR